MAAVSTRPPSIRGIHISVPVRAVIELKLEPKFVLELDELCELCELCDDCAEATPATDTVITTARNAPAKIRRTIDPVMRT
jgi:ferredoxin